MVEGFELLVATFGVIFDHDLQRAQHRHAPRRGSVEHLADGKLEHGEIDDAVGLGDADPFDKVPNSLRGHAAAAQASKRRHPRIIPAEDMAAAHKLG